MRRLREKFFQNEDPIGKHFGTEADNSRRYEVVGIAKDARYLTLDKPDGAFFLLPEAQADYSQPILVSLFLHDIVILTRPRASLSDAQVRQAMLRLDPSLPIISIRTLREKVAGASHAATTHRTHHLVVRDSFVGFSLHWALRNYCLQCRPPHGRDWRAHGAGR